MHPDSFLINKYLSLFQQKFHIKVSTCFVEDSSGAPVPDRSAGGLISMIKKDLLDNDANLEFDEVIPGRAAALRIALGAHSSTYWNVHNYGFTKDEVTMLHNLINIDIVKGHTDPQHFSMWLVGDLNREPLDFPRISVKDPTSQTFPHESQNTNANFGYKWDDIFGKLVEIYGLEPTHYSAEGMYLNKLDRFFTTIPSHAWITVQPSVQTLLAPDVAHYRGVSDHGINKCGVSLRAMPNPDTMPIRAECFQTLRFKQRLQSWYECVDLSSMGTWERWDTHKIILRDAAIHSRNHMLLADKDSDFTLQGTISSLTRAIWQNNVKLAAKIIDRSNFAKKHVDISSGRVELVCPAMYETEVSELKHAFLAKSVEQLNRNSNAPFISEQVRKKINSKKAAAHRLMKLWLPSSRRVVLHGLKVDNGNGGRKIVTDPKDISRGLAEGWKPVFEKKEINESKARLYANRFPGHWEWSRASRPTKSNVAEVMKKLPKTASGPDGLPYCAWQQGGDEAVETLWQITDAQCEGETPPRQLNDSVTLFVPKGELEDDHIQVVREVGDNRPLSLKNSDNKIATAAVNNCAQPVIVHSVHKFQNGFVKGRQLLQNVVDLDALARILSMNASMFNSGADLNKLKVAILAFFDFAAAFPSVAHQWLFIALEASGAPSWFYNYVKALYSANDTYHMNSHGKQFLFAFLAGVLQGCPLSATLFLFAINPFLVHFEQALQGKYNGEVRACADDIGICLSDFRSLKVVFKVFECAKDFANLNLKPIKCNIIPLNQIDPLFDNGEKEKKYIHGWLVDHLPQWRDFVISLCAKYLGFYMGPKSSEKVWKAPKDKFVKRVSEIAQSKMNHNLATLAYNGRAIPVLGYIGQLLPAPPVQQLERSLLHHLFHLPTNSWERNTFAHLHEIGLRNVVSVDSYCRAAMIRTANNTIKGWKKLYDEIVEAAELSLSVSRVASRQLSTEWWDTPPYVQFLNDAYYGKGSYADTLQASMSARSAARDPENKKSIQAIAHSTINSIRKNDEATYMLLFRRTVALGFSSQAVISRQDVCKAFAVATRARPNDALAWFKTVTNAWCTSSRMHEPITLDCIFGCPGCEDRVSHYLSCPILWALLDEAFPGAVAPTCFGRVNFSNPSIKNIFIISTAFEIYHALKIGLRTEVDNSQTSKRFKEICRVSSRIAQEKGTEYRHTADTQRRVDERASHPGTTPLRRHMHHSNLHTPIRPRTPSGPVTFTRAIHVDDVQSWRGITTAINADSDLEA